MKSKKLKSILACTLILCMVFGIQSNLAFVFAQENEEAIEFSNATVPYSGTYLISTKESLVALSIAVNSGNTMKNIKFQLQNDIILNNGQFSAEENNLYYTPDKSYTAYPVDIQNATYMENEQLMTFIPIGFQAKSDSSLWENNGFAGEFYGNGYEIKGIFINDNSGDSEAHYKGLFGALLDGGVVSNLSVSGCVYSTGSNTGGIVGKSSGLIEHCRFSGVVMGAYNVGGIVGESNTESTITNCMNMAHISGGSTGTAGGNWGGIAGCANGKAIQNCINHGNVTSNTFANVGGVIGVGSASITTCINWGSITGPTNSKTTGGIAGSGRKNNADNNFICITTSEELEKYAGIPALNNFSCGAVLYLNGGSFYENIVVTSDTLAIPIKKGYVFGGWYENADFSGTSVENIEKGNIYYAKWNEKASTSISFKDGLDLNKIYDENAVSLSENDYTVTEGAGKITFIYQTKEDNEWKNIDTAPINAGTYQVKAIVAENDTHKRAETDWKEFIISKAMPTYEVPTNLTAIVGQTLADVTLPESFAWQDDTTTSVGSAGTNTFKVTYTPKDTTNYNTVTDIEVILTVNPKMEELNAIPIINASDKTLTVGDTFNPLEGVTASDKEDGDLTKVIEVLENNVDTSKASIYEITYKVTDSKGASSTKTITVTVKAKDTQNPTIDDNKKPSATDTDKKPASTDKQTTSNSPKTGDSTNMTTWLALMFVSLGLLAGVFTVRKSRKSR